MAIAHSKVTAQGQISIPAEVRKKLGIGPGSTLEWAELNDQIVVRRTGHYSTADVHNLLFPVKASTSRKQARVDVKEGIRKYIRKRHAGN